LFDATAFRNHYDNLESIEPGTPFQEAGHEVIPFDFANGLAGTVSGAEFGVDARPSTRCLLRASYSFLDMSLHPTAGSRDTTSSSEGGSTPRHMVTASSSWNLPQSFLIDAHYRWIADRPTQKVASYSEVDLRVSRHMSAHLDLAAVGANLLHTHHAEFGGVIEIRRSVYGEAQWHW
jgi:iron complex outermembrane receptor protein